MTVGVASELFSVASNYPFRAGGVSDPASYWEVIPVNFIFIHHLQKTRLLQEHLMALYERNDFVQSFCL